MTSVTLNYFGHEFEVEVLDVEAKVGIAHHNMTLGSVTKRVAFFRHRSGVFYSTIEGLLAKEKEGSNGNRN